MWLSLLPRVVRIGSSLQTGIVSHTGHPILKCFQLFFQKLPLSYFDMWYSHAAVSKTVAMEPRICSQCFVSPHWADVIYSEFTIILTFISSIKELLLSFFCSSSSWYRPDQNLLKSSHASLPPWRILVCRLVSTLLTLGGSSTLSSLIWFLNSSTMLDQPCLCGACHKPRMTTLNVFYSPQTREMEHLLN